MTIKNLSLLLDLDHVRITVNLSILKRYRWSLPNFDITFQGIKLKKYKKDPKKYKNCLTKRTPKMTIRPLISFLRLFCNSCVLFCFIRGYFCIFLGEEPWGHFCIFWGEKLGAILYFLGGFLVLVSAFLIWSLFKVFKIFIL